MKSILLAFLATMVQAIHWGAQDLLQSQSEVVAGITTQGKKYYQLNRPSIDIRYLSDQDDKLMNRLILTGHAVVLEKNFNGTMESSDDSYCGCNCRCCFDLQAEGKSEDQCSKSCGCDCECCKAHQSKLTQYWMDKTHTLSVAKELVGEYKKLAGAKLDEYINLNFYDLWEHFDVNKTGLIEIERMSQFYKMLLKDMALELQ